MGNPQPPLPSPALTASGARGVFDTMLNNALTTGLSRLMTLIGLPILFFAASQFWEKIDGYDTAIKKVTERHAEDMKELREVLVRQNEVIIGLQIRQGIILQHLSAVESKVFGVPLVTGATVPAIPGLPTLPDESIVPPSTRRPSQ